MDIQFAKYMILCAMMIIGVVPAFFKYLEPHKNEYEREYGKDYSGAKEWLFWWWILPVIFIVRFLLSN